MGQSKARIEREDTTSHIRRISSSSFIAAGTHIHEGKIKHDGEVPPRLAPRSFDTRGGAKPITEAKSEYIREPHERGERWGMRQAATEAK